MVAEHISGQAEPERPQARAIAGIAILLAARLHFVHISVMTETSDKTVTNATVAIAEPMSPSRERFVLHWGEMGTVWGVNRSVGQIHGLLYLADRPLTAEEIAEELGLARSNVSTSLKELVAWQLVRRVHVRGDRRDHFEAETDLWEMVTRIAEGRKAREIDPTLAVLRACEAEAASEPAANETSRQRIVAMRAFLEMMDAWSVDIKRVPRGKLVGLLKLGSSIARLLPARAAPGVATTAATSARGPLLDTAALLDDEDDAGLPPR